MRQNRVGWLVAGALGVASILAAPLPVEAVIVGSDDVPKSIPDDDATGITSTLTVTIEGMVTDVNLLVNDLTHTCLADLQLDLTPPSGGPVTLVRSFADSGIFAGLGCPENFISTVLDDAAPTNLTAGSPPYRGSFAVDHGSVPAMPLSALNGVPAAGTWTLAVSDRASGDVGTLHRWSLDIAVATTTTSPATSTTTTLVQGTGFVPPTKSIRKCEDRAARALAKLAGRTVRCRVRAARAALAGRTFDEDGCEAAARSAFISTTTAGCPTCLDLPAIAQLAERNLDGLKSRLYCEGTVPF